MDGPCGLHLTNLVNFRQKYMHGPCDKARYCMEATIVTKTLS
ncbi:hypothetical protein HanPI659440_Chr09g0346891 [Helianthus annuus]|nr:hypothetical protein HanPI659440_Chr09g0346891 [Helianthus annuus]